MSDRGVNDSVIGIACPVACDRGWGVLKVCVIDKTVSVSITHLWHRCHRFGGNRLTVAYITTGLVSITTTNYNTLSKTRLIEPDCRICVVSRSQTTFFL